MPPKQAGQQIFDKRKKRKKAKGEKSPMFCISREKLSDCIIGFEGIGSVLLGKRLISYPDLQVGQTIL